ncbi:MAG: hypothetical protein LBP67_00220 [Bacteroidales bacterium]|jgi:hypothetical protein|nr:hypothetical protein [Bacteroidales bacterium]
MPKRFCLIVLLSSIILGAYAQTPYDYKSKWNKVDEFFNKQLPESALKIIEEIEQHAKKENNSPEMIAVSIYKVKIASQYEENFQINAINDFEKIITTSNFPEKNIYYSLTAQLYTQYLRSNFWKISNLSNSTEKSDDINTWSRENLLEKAYDYYLKSLDNSSKLQKIPIDDYKVILEQEENPDRNLRPTLYDILAFRTLTFLSDSENNLLGKTLNNQDYLSTYNTFTRLVLPENTETNDYLELSMKLFQDILKFHYNDPAPFIDAELLRLEFAYNNITDFDGKDEKYLEALFSLERNFAQHESASDIMFAIANYYYNKASEYDPEISDEYKDYFVKALAYCKKNYGQFPETKGGINCYNLMLEIENEDISNLVIAGCNYPDEYFPASISFKNMKELYVRVVQIDFDDEFISKNIYSNLQNDKTSDILLSKKPVEEFKLDIPENIDYRTHTAEIILPPLKIGAYAVIICNKDSFNKKNDKITIATFQITKLNSLLLDTDNNMEFIVSDRNSGHNLKNCNISFYITEGWGGNRKQTLVSKQTTDDKGKLTVNKNELKKLSGKSSHYMNYSIIISNGEDKFLFDNYIDTYSNNSYERQQTSFFIDRAIYRPGQTVYFKAIAHNGFEENFSVVPNKTIKINFKDSNYKNIQTLNLRTNEFGSCNGEFIIPNDCQPGVYTIDDGNNTIFFNVEEYKRPSFEINFEKTSEQNIANQEVCIKINAKSLTGISLNNATVKYSVNRSSYFRFFNSNNAAIDNGTITLDENGDGIICFNAICPTNKKYFIQPLYLFNINVDVTDNSGETISGNYSIRISDKSIILSSKNPEFVSDEFIINTTNTDNDPVKAKLQIKIYKLTEPNDIARPRLWASDPDTFIYSEKEYKNKLPKDAYKNENSYTNWEKGDLIVTINDSDGKINIKDLKLAAGFYVIDASTNDNFGNDIEESFYFYTFDKEKQHTFSSEGISLLTSKSSGKPGEKFNIYLSSSHKKTNVRLLVYSPKRIIYDDYISINGIKSFSFDINEEDRGNIRIVASATFNNRVYNNSQSIEVLFDNKNINIKLLTERNYIIPGTKENWSLSLTDYQNNITDAELLATMYDMSLDYFTKDNSSRFNLYRSVKSKYNFSFRNINGLSRQWGLNNYNFKTKNVKPVVYDDFKLANIYSPVYYGGIYPNATNTRMMKQSALSGKGELIEDEAEFYEMSDSDGIIVNEEVILETGQDIGSDQNQSSIRRDFRETAFFYPQLKANKDGNVEFEFIVPESMTKWKFRAWAHTKDMSTGYFETEIVSKKDIFIQANTPKVLYEKDIIDYSAKISNLTSENHYGTAFIEVYDLFGNDITNQVTETNKIHFDINENSSTYVSWRLFVPENTGILKIRCGAETIAHKDIEEHIIPVLTTKILITESLPLSINKKGLNKFTFDSFKNKFGNSKYTTQSMTFEYSANPVWYAIQSLPFLSEGDEMFSLTVFNKLYSNLVSEYIVKTNPEIQEVYKQVKITNPESFASQLAQNQELKNILLSETPWILDAENEELQRERMASLFDENKIGYTKNSMFNKLKNMQHSSGAFTWIENSNYPSYYITLNIVIGFANLYTLDIIEFNDEIKSILNPAINYLDTEITKTYNNLEKNNSLDKYVISSDIIKYLYARHIFAADNSISKENSKAYEFFISCLPNNWNTHGLEMQAMTAIILHNTGKQSVAQLILKSINERALHSDELGMYWRDLQNSYAYSSSIATMAALIECYNTISRDSKSISEMQRWLLNQKRTNSWESGPTTSKAIYALLINNSSKITVKCEDEITIGNMNIDISKVSAGSGYIKESFSAPEITKDFADISINKATEGTAWGAAYWQYTTDYENVTSASAGLSVNRKILKSSYSDSSINFTEIGKDEEVNNTDKIVVRIIINSDREYEYVHLKDILPACFIPEQKLSGYSFTGNLMYYTSIKDESMNFFIEYLPKGTHIIEYKVNIQQSGEFTGGISKIQSMYAPEFGGQSDGIKIYIKR